MKKLLISLIALAALSGIGCMSVPSDLHVFVSTNGCNSQAECPWQDGTTHNYYDANLHEIVVAPEQSLKTWAHEACHAHQQMTVIAETGQDVSPVLQPGSNTHLPDLHEWLTTREAQDYAVAVATDGPPQWGTHGIALLEDFAEACGRYLVPHTYMPGLEMEVSFEISPARSAFFAARDFK
jgi:hypothetical protein